MDQIKVCRICGDKANCFNFGGFPSCPACRSFFQRNATKYDKQKCLKEGKCDIDFVTRKGCVKCRLDKCFGIGMVLKSKEEKKNGKLVKLQNEYEQQADSDTTIGRNESTIESILESNIRKNISICSDDIHNDNINKDKNLKRGKFKPAKKQTILPILRTNRRLKRSLKLNQIESQQIDIIENAFNVFEVEENQLPVAGEENIIHFIFNLSTAYSRPAVKFCKKIPFFASLSQAEQLALIKPFFSEALLIRNAFFFDKGKMGFYALKDECAKEAVLIKVENIFPPQCANLIDQNTQIVIRLHEAMENDIRIRKMLSALVLVKPLADYPKYSEILRYQYFVYRHLFRRYLEAKYGTAQLAQNKFNLLMNIIEKDFQIAKDNARSLLIEHGVDQVADLVAEVLSIKID